MIRYLAKEHGEIHVFSGPLYLSHTEADGRKFVTYEVIGENEVAVPSAFFKIILSVDNDPIEAYILPNKPIASNEQLESFQTTVEKVEKAAGMVLIGKRRE